MVSVTACAAAAFAAGAYMTCKLDIFFILLFTGAYFLICLIARAAGHKTAPERLILIAVFCLGAVLTRYYSSPDMQDLQRYKGYYVTVTGRVCETPDKDGENNRYIVDVRRVTLDGVPKDVKERVIITSPDDYDFADTAEFSGFINEIDDKLNENGFDFKRYYKSKGIFFRCYAYTSAPSDFKITERSFYWYSSRLKNSIAQLLDKYTLNDKGAVLKAVITGDKSSFSDEFSAVLTRTGTMRFFYPAFLHVMLIISVIGIFSGTVKRKYRDAAAVILLLFYALLSSSHPVMIKGCAVAAFLTVFRRRLGYVYFADVLGAAVLAVGIANPLLLFDSGFVMSAAASLLMSVFAVRVSKRVKIKNKYARHVITTGIICTVGLMPLCAYYFYGLSPYTIITALIFLPATAVILVLSPLLLAMLALFKAAPVVGQIITVALWVYMKLPYVIDALPLSHIALPKPQMITIIAFYAAVYGLHLIIRKRGFAAALAACAAVSLFAEAAAFELPRLKRAEFTFVNVGQGDGAIIRRPYRNTVLIDGGGGNEYNDYNPGESEYLPYLESMGISGADCAIVSHCHSDHADGIIAAIKNIRVRHLYVPETSPDNEVYQQLLNAAAQYGTQVHTVSDITTLNFRSGLKITMFPPGDNALLDRDENDKSLLIRVSYGETDCLFTGDMPKAEEFGLVSAGNVTKAEILKVAHHGSDTSSSSMFLEAADPDYAVISVGEDNVYGHPADEVLERLSGARILRTDKNGDITISADKSGIVKIKTYK